MRASCLNIANMRYYNNKTGTSLFLTNRLDLSLPMLIILDTVYFFMICYFQPYLTDNEYLTICQVGRDLGSIINERKRCSKTGCGTNNLLDAILYLGETFILSAAWIVSIIYKYKILLRIWISKDAIPRAWRITMITCNTWSKL